MRRSRRGYYADISYVDDLIGGLLGTLRRRAASRDDTVVHPDLRPRRFPRRARALVQDVVIASLPARVPLIVHAPGRFEPRRVAAPVSIADMLPTVVDIAEPGVRAGSRAAWMAPACCRCWRAAPGSRIASRSASTWRRACSAPMYMVRQGHWKFITCMTDPDQLFNLAADPREDSNVAGDPAHADLVAAFRSVLDGRFDAAATRRDVIASQQARLTVFRALNKGKVFPWDYQPLRLACEQYTRNHRDVTATDVLSRYPPIEA